MPITVLAEVDPTMLAVRLTVSGGAPAYVAQANPAGDRAAYTVRTEWSGTGASRVGVDGDAPLNTEIQYVVTDQLGAQAVSATVTIPADRPVIASAIDPTTALLVTVAGQKPNNWQARSVWFDVLGSRAPFVSVAPMRLRDGQLDLRAETRADRAALVDLLGLGHPLTLRAVCPDAVDDLVLLPLSVSESLMLTEAPAGATVFSIQYQAVSRELGPYTSDPGRTWAQLVTEQATWADVLASYPDWAAVLAGDPNAGLGAEQLGAGDFPAGPVAPWSTFWTHSSVVWSGSSTALATAAADPTPVAAVLWQQANRPIPVGATVMRVTGRVRSTSAGTTVRAEILTNDLANPAEYFAPGSQGWSTVVATAGPAWAPFAVDIAIGNPAHLQWTLYLRGEGVASGAAVEFDDLSAKWRL
jgi:hypothetical protein